MNPLNNRSAGHFGSPHIINSSGFEDSQTPFTSGGIGETSTKDKEVAKDSDSIRKIERNPK
jgi:hypothetical protein